MAHYEVIVSLWLASCNKHTGVCTVCEMRLLPHTEIVPSLTVIFLRLLCLFLFYYFVQILSFVSCFDILSSITFIFIWFYYFSLKSPWQGFTCCHSLPCIIKTVDLKSNFIDRNKLILNSSDKTNQQVTHIQAGRSALSSKTNTLLSTTV